MILSTFFKKFKDNTQRTPVDFIQHERIQRAKLLLQKDQLSLLEIADRCGFKSYEYFCTSFKKLVHCKPTEFKRRVRG